MRLLRPLIPLLLVTPALADEIWVTNEKDNTISVIDTESLEVTRTIPVGERPRGITFSKDFSVVYVCASDSDAVEVIDPASGKVLHDLPSGEDPEQFVLHPDNRHLYIANENDAVITEVDVTNSTVVNQINVGVEPEGMAVSPDGKTVIGTSETTSMAHWIDAETGKVFGNSLVDTRPRHAEFTADGKELWVSSEVGGTLAVFDTATRQQKAKISFEIQGVQPENIQPVGFVFAPDQKTAFVALGPANHLAVINMQSFAVERYIMVGKRVWHVALSADGTRLFSTNGVSGDVTVVDVASREPIKTIQVGRYPWGAALRIVKK